VRLRGFPQQLGEFYGKAAGGQVIFT